MKPLEKGPDTGLVEIPANWYLDDLPVSIIESHSLPFRPCSIFIVHKMRNSTEE